MAGLPRRDKQLDSGAGPATAIPEHARHASRYPSRHAHHRPRGRRRHQPSGVLGRAAPVRDGCPPESHRPAQQGPGKLLAAQAERLARSQSLPPAADRARHAEEYRSELRELASGRSPHHLHAFSITPAHPRVAVLGERAKACRHFGGISALCRACPSSTLLAARVLAPAAPWLQPTGGDHPGTAREDKRPDRS